ncbi:sel1 repeat family protein [Microtetraspora sp. AC03309]|uniref:tetratricopeptide repeat protein n=1 Tax=Microtetraspora sp. AC03309 TaxID=2779376 RepID=UPI001E33B734|nr:tetratricopeptide repeat protein [Microtetraspora sp. AC03309]MCC5576439.1 sel1 repeat family protein [Microtetraspora sp. AC03309]
MTEIIEAAHRALSAANSGSEEGRIQLDRLRDPLLELAAQGDAEAQSVLGGIALEHDEDPAAALMFWTLSADQGHPAGQRGLGHLYVTGAGVPRDLEKAVQLFQAAAAAGDPLAMFNLAMLHLKGDVTDRMPPEEVMPLMQAAAELGVKEASAVVGDWLAAMNDDQEALWWYVRAAESGHVGAMFIAASRYRDGLGTASNAVQAVRWFLKMLDSGNGDGVHEAIQLARSMTDEQIREAANLAGRRPDAQALISAVRPR